MQNPTKPNPPPDPDADPMGYIRYVLGDMTDLLKNANPDPNALLRRIEYISTVLEGRTLSDKDAGADGPT